MKKKVRILLGPNGSGKSTLKKILEEKHKIDFGFFINADDLQRQLNTKGSVSHALLISRVDLTEFLQNHPLNHVAPMNEFAAKISVQGCDLHIEKHQVTSYEAAALADYFRQMAMKHSIPFSFETVFSDPSKIHFVRKLKKSGYQVYFYIVSTLNPEINKGRIQKRVKHHGHDVPVDKIVSRYAKSLLNAGRAMRYTDRCFVIDNSQELDPVLVAEVSHGSKVVFLNSDYQPIWVKAILSKLKKQG